MQEFAREVRQVPRDKVLIVEGSPSTNEIFYLHRGTCVAEIGGKVVGKIESGEFFGEVAPMLQSHRTATVRALSDCQIFVFRGLDDQNLYEVISRDPKMLRKFTEQMALRLMETSRRHAGDMEKADALLRAYRKALSGVLFVLGRYVQRTNHPLLSGLAEHIRQATGMSEGKREDVPPALLAADPTLLT